MIRISASDLEGWRFWRNQENAPLSDLIARLSHTAPPNRKMLAGRAFAKFFELADPGEMDSAVVEGWRFNFALKDAIALSPVREIKQERVYQTPSGPVTLVCKADGAGGVEVKDQKLSERLDTEAYYLDSYQWRAYLVVFGAKRFVYDVFVGKYSDYDDEVTITEYHPMDFFSYPDMEADVERAVCEVAEIVARYLPERVTKDEGPSQMELEVGLC